MANQDSSRMVKKIALKRRAIDERGGFSVAIMIVTL